MNDENKPNTFVAVRNNREVELIDPSTTKLEQIESEFEEIKLNLQQLASVGEESAKNLLALAKSSQHHLVFQALAAVLKATTDANKELGVVLEKKKELIQGQQINNGPQVVNNTLNVTTTEMIDMIKAKNGVSE